MYYWGGGGAKAIEGGMVGQESTCGGWLQRWGRREVDKADCLGLTA
jgi:hypothetical protein